MIGFVTGWYSGVRIDSADFLHCWVANSIWLERAKSLITTVIAFMAAYLEHLQISLQCYL